MPSTRRRRKRPTTTADYLAAVRRMIAKVAVRAVDDDMTILASVVALHGEIDQALTAAVAGLRANGYTWKAIGDALGVTPQAVMQRWPQPSKGDHAAA